MVRLRVRGRADLARHPKDARTSHSVGEIANALAEC
jgi:hypothetical protein